MEEVESDVNNHRPRALGVSEPGGGFGRREEVGGSPRVGNGRLFDHIASPRDERGESPQDAQSMSFWDTAPRPGTPPAPPLEPTQPRQSQETGLQLLCLLCDSHTTESDILSSTSPAARLPKKSGTGETGENRAKSYLASLLRAAVESSGTAPSSFTKRHTAGAPRRSGRLPTSALTSQRKSSGRSTSAQGSRIEQANP